MKTLLIIAHTPSVNTQTLADAVYAGALEQARLETIEYNIVIQSPQQTQVEDVVNADALILGTTENLAYMSGLTKDFFDRCYYDLLEKKQGMPYAVYIRAGHDGTATKQGLTTINNGLKWQLIDEYVLLTGEWTDDFLITVRELAMTMVAGTAMGLF